MLSHYWYRTTPASKHEKHKPHQPKPFQSSQNYNFIFCNFYADQTQNKSYYSAQHSFKFKQSRDKPKKNNIRPTSTFLGNLSQQRKATKHTPTINRTRQRSPHNAIRLRSTRSTQHTHISYSFQLNSNLLIVLHTHTHKHTPPPRRRQPTKPMPTQPTHLKSILTPPPNTTQPCSNQLDTNQFCTTAPTPCATTNQPNRSCCSSYFNTPTNLSQLQSLHPKPNWQVLLLQPLINLNQRPRRKADNKFSDTTSNISVYYHHYYNNNYYDFHFSTLCLLTLQPNQIMTLHNKMAKHDQQCTRHCTLRSPARQLQSAQLLQ